jgi:hypothetical protein
MIMMIPRGEASFPLPVTVIVSWGWWRKVPVASTMISSGRRTINLMVVMPVRIPVPVVMYHVAATAVVPIGLAVPRDG